MQESKLELVRSFLHQKPFRTFRIVMRSGKRYEITDPIRVAIGRTMVYLPTEKLAQLPEAEIDVVYEPRNMRARL